MGATFTSFYFLCFYVCLLFLYYLVPKKIRWCVLLFSSIAYYLLSGNGILILYPLVSCLSAYIGIRIMGEEGKTSKRKAAQSCFLNSIFQSVLAVSRSYLSYEETELYMPAKRTSVYSQFIGKNPAG